MVKDVLQRLVPAVINYYFIHNFHALSSALQHRRQLNRQNLASLIMFHSSFKSFYNIIMMQNNQNQTQKVQNI